MKKYVFALIYCIYVHFSSCIADKDSMALLIARGALRKDILKAKLEAIRSGKLTDTVFLVGANGSNKLWVCTHKYLHFIKT